MSLERYVLKAEDYVNNNTPVAVSCPLGHNYQVTVGNFGQGRRCPVCASHSSVAEREIFEVVNALVSGVIPNTRKPLGGLELDVWCPDQKVGIEYHGLFWHSEAGGKDKKYHLKKLEAAEKAGARLLQFFEDEWRDKRPIVESIIKRALKLNKDIRHGARELDLRVVDDVKARALFFNQNHLQGDRASEVAWGLYEGGVLVQCLSLRKNSFTGGEPFYDIARVATLSGHQVSGGLSRLLAASRAWLAARGVPWLHTYADRRYSQGQAYLAVGFEPMGVSAPGFCYTDNQRRVHRFNLRKTKDCPADMTNDDWRRSQGWSKLWDCGQLKFRISTKQS